MYLDVRCGRVHKSTFLYLMFCSCSTHDRLKLEANFKTIISKTFLIPNLSLIQNLLKKHNLFVNNIVQGLINFL